MVDLETVITGQESRLGDVDKFLAVVRKYTDIQTLTPAITNEFIDRIVVHEPEKARGNRIQKVDIVYNGVGLVELPQDEKHPQKSSEVNANTICEAVGA